MRGHARHHSGKLLKAMSGRDDTAACGRPFSSAPIDAAAIAGRFGYWEQPWRN